MSFISGFYKTETVNHVTYEVIDTCYNNLHVEKLARNILDELTCSVSLTLLEEALVLNCGHCFNASSLGDILNTNPSDLLCPECNTPVQSATTEHKIRALSKEILKLFNHFNLAENETKSSSSLLSYTQKKEITDSVIRRITERSELRQQSVIASAKSEGIAQNREIRAFERESLLTEGYNNGYNAALQSTKENR